MFLFKTVIGRVIEVRRFVNGPSRWARWGTGESDTNSGSRATATSSASGSCRLQHFRLGVGIRSSRSCAGVS